MTDGRDLFGDEEVGLKETATAQTVTDQLFDAPGPAETGDPAIDHHLDVIFNSWAKGFREVLLVAVIARLVDPEYSPSTDFYACHPRALYDYGPIRRKLTELNIPRGKSGPLNIAKGAQGLNSEWAARRRPKNAAHAVVDLVVQLEQNDQEWAGRLGCAMAERFLAIARRVAALEVDLDPSITFHGLAEIVLDLVKNQPDGGATAQQVVGLILETSSADGISVEGHGDSVSATNTTSGKAGDLHLISEEGAPRVIEVTSKAFDAERIEDSYESVMAIAENLGDPITSVLVLLRPEDVPDSAEITAPLGDLSTYLGHLDKGGLHYDFVDIYEWIVGQLSTFTDAQRSDFHDLLNQYVADPNTNENIKAYWSGLHDIE